MDDFLLFPMVINPSSYGRRFDSNDLYNLGVLLKVSSGQNKMFGLIWNLSPLPTEKW
jgi:hypothetical protein